MLFKLGGFFFNGYIFAGFSRKNLEKEESLWTKTVEEEIEGVYPREERPLGG